MSNDHDGVEIAAAVKAIRAELAAAAEDADGEDLLFAVGPVELEFQVAVTKGGEGGAAAKFWVVSVGGKATYSHRQTHTVRMTLTPHHRESNKPVNVADDDDLN